MRRSTGPWGVTAAWVVAVGLAVAMVVTLGHAVAAEKAPADDAPQKEKPMSKADAPPRKVIVGTSMYAMWGKYPGLEKRLAQLCGLVDEMAAKAKKQYGRSVDICALPEVAVSGGAGYGPKGSFPLAGPVMEAFAAKAREHKCYIVVPLFEKATENGATVYYNSCALVGRKGELVGNYHKVHPVSGESSDVLEGGVLPGKGFPVFACDFGKVGIQICWDMAYDDGWEILGRKGAELVIWSTQSPGQIKAAFRAMRNDYYVLTSTWRNNASLFDPTGAMIRSIVTKDRQRVFAHEIDLEYRLIGWQPKLRNGVALAEKYGDKVGYRYSEAEDGGIFWSNDPAVPIDRMVRETGLRIGEGKVEKDREIQDRLRGGPPSAE